MVDGSKRLSDDRKVKLRLNIPGDSEEGKGWIPAITAVSFAISVSLLFISSNIMEGASIPVALCIVLLIVAIGILFDIIGMAVTAADETPFHAMASRKLFGAKKSIKMIRNAHKVSSICNDVIGDICSVISGSASALIIVRMSVGRSPTEALLISLAISGLVASMTVGGKAFGKTLAIHNSNYIIYKVAVLLSLLQSRSRDNKRRNRK